MVDLASLWLPILLSAVLVFVASSVLHMVLPIHKNDLGKLPHEDAVMAALREQSIPPGEYCFPRADSMKECGSPEMRTKFERGPVGLLTIVPSGPPKMGAALVQWFVFCLVVSLIVGYVGTFTRGAGAAYDDVFRLTGTVALLGYATSNVMNSIWKGSSWLVTAKFAFDGLIYALLTAGVFGWLWPDAG